MSIPDSESESTSLRDQLVASVAEHTAGAGPDLDSIVSGAREERDQGLREKDRERRADGRQWEGEQSDKRRTAIRNALNEEKLKAARGSPQPATAVNLKPGAPASWDQAAKADFHTLPEHLQLAAKREEAGYKAALEREPRIAAYAEIDKVLAPVRETFRAAGVESDAEALSSLLGWESLIRNPQTRAQAFHDLARQYGSSLHEIMGVGGQQPAMQASPEQVAQASREIGQFSQGREHFAKVRESMGLLISRHGERYLQANGSINLEAAYRDACKLEGLNVGAAQPRTRPVARSSSPAPRAEPRQSVPVRDTLMSAVRDSRNRGRV